MKETNQYDQKKEKTETYFQKTQNYLKSYAKKCRDSYNWMLSL